MISNRLQYSGLYKIYTWCSYTAAALCPDRFVRCARIFPISRRLPDSLILNFLVCGIMNLSRSRKYFGGFIGCKIGPLGGFVGNFPWIPRDEAYFLKKSCTRQYFLPSKVFETHSSIPALLRHKRIEALVCYLSRLVESSWNRKTESSHSAWHKRSGNFVMLVRWHVRMLLHE